jgi:hypothetical protein
MSGGIVQLVATGAQDAWLTGKPEVSFFRSNYRRYTHYAHSVERQIIQGQPTPGGISTIRFEKKGDLLSYVYFTAHDNNGSMVSNLDWSKVIDKVELMIGGQIIDTQDFEYSTDIEPLTGAQNFSQRYLNNQTASQATPTNQKSVFYPLKFFFCKDWSVSLPLVALQFHDVELRITWSTTLGSMTTINPTEWALPNQPLFSAAAQTQVSIFNTTIGLGAVGSNTANLVQTSIVGPPLAQGTLLVAANSNLQTNTCVIQSFANTSSNIIVAFANTANTNVISATYSGKTINAFTPVITGTLSSVASPANTSFTTTLSFSGGFRSPLGQATTPTVGQYVAGFPVEPAVVTAVSGTTITVTHPTVGSTGGSNTSSVPTGTILSFFNPTTSNATSSTRYSDLMFRCWSNFVYLDETERNFFAKGTQDLLITQVNRVTILNNPVQELALAQPVKFLAFAAAHYPSIYANGAGSVAASRYVLKTQINGVDVGEFRSLPAYVDAAHYYNTPFGYMHNNQVANVAIISYCLDTSKLQPTGTLNFSRLDTFRLVTDPQMPNGIRGLTDQSTSSPYLYAVNYNVLRIQNGLGGLLYAN